MKKRFLFVDDDLKVLEGLRRRLRSMAKDWDLDLAEGGKAALALMEQKTFDVVVSDMRMPGMDGAELLSEVKKRCPETIRIILSGFSDDETVLRAMGPMHQYLSKPVDPKVLKLTVERACTLHDLLADETLRVLVGEKETLPDIPSMYADMVRLLQSPDAPMKEVANILSSDVEMTDKILQLVNSAFFGLSREITTPEAAVYILGVDAIKALALSVQLFALFDEANVPDMSLSMLWSHSVTSGSYAKEIARMENFGRKVNDDTLMAGLVHDAGKLVLATRVPESYGQVASAARSRRIPMEAAERERFGITHAEVGAYLLNKWGLPDPIVEAVAFHHRPEDCPFQAFSSLTAVHAANALEHVITNPADPSGRVNRGYLEGLGLADRMEDWKDGCRELQDD